MRILLDACVWGGAKGEIERAGHQVEWVGDWAEDPGDEVVLRHARQTGAILVTLDKDFGEWAIVHGAPHCGIMRLVHISARLQARACLATLSSHAKDILEGAIVTVEPGRIRIRLES